MKMGPRKFILPVLMAVLLAAVLVVTSCSGSTSPTTSASGATPSPVAVKNAEIRLGVMGGQTGPAASAIVPWLQELDMFVRYTNEVEGGIDGVKINMRTADNKGSPDGAIIAYKGLRDDFHPQMFLCLEDYLLLGIKDTIVQDQAVFLSSAALDPRLYVPPGRFFSIAIPTVDGFAGYLKWTKENWKGSGNPKVGVLYYDLASGVGNWKPAEPYAAKLGVELVPMQYPYATADFTPMLMKMRDSGVTSIWMLANDSQAVLAIRDSNGLGLTGKIPITFGEYVQADRVLALSGKAAEGFQVVRAESPYSDNAPAAQLFTKVYKWAKGEEKWSDNRLMVNVKATLAAAVRQAVKDVGSAEKITGADMYNALNKLTAIDTLGNSQGYGYGPDRRFGVQQMKISRMAGTGTVSASDWIVLPRTFEGIDK